MHLSVRAFVIYCVARSLRVYRPVTAHHHVAFRDKHFLRLSTVFCGRVEQRRVYHAVLVHVLLFLGRKILYSGDSVFWYTAIDSRIGNLFQRVFQLAHVQPLVHEGCGGVVHHGMFSFLSVNTVYYLPYLGCGLVVVEAVNPVRNPFPFVRAEYVKTAFVRFVQLSFYPSACPCVVHGL